MTELERATATVVDAYTTPGPAPAWHYRHVAALHANWPRLADALDQLATAHSRAPIGEPPD